MSFLDHLAKFFALDWRSSHTPIQINPATGLPMVGEGTGGVDVQGNPFGADLRRQDDPAWPSDPEEQAPSSHATPSTGVDWWTEWPSSTSSSHDPMREF